MAKRDYEKIAKSKITHPADNPDPNRRILVYSRKKVGKTDFSATAPDVLIIDPEKGTDTKIRSNPAVWKVEKWEDMQDVYGYLRLGKHPYRWVSLDGLTRINNMALRYVGRVAEERDLDRRPGMVDRRDYNKSGELMKQMLNNFHNLRMGVIFTCHERVEVVGGGSFGGDDDEEEDDEGTAMWVPDLPRGVRGHINGLVDVIGRMYWRRVQVRNKTTKETKEVKQRRLWIGNHERYDTGFRSDWELPDMVKNPTVPKLVQLMLEGE
jgi:hypothetical protein